jgi:hypothetical protein
LVPERVPMPLFSFAGPLQWLMVGATALALLLVV